MNTQIQHIVEYTWNTSGTDSSTYDIEFLKRMIKRRMALNEPMHDGSSPDLLRSIPGESEREIVAGSRFFRSVAKDLPIFSAINNGY